MRLALDDNSFSCAYGGHCVCAGAVAADAKCECSWFMQALHLSTAGYTHCIADVRVSLPIVGMHW